jgi:hypothetical protein
VALGKKVSPVLTLLLLLLLTPLHSSILEDIQFIQPPAAQSQQTNKVTEWQIPRTQTPPVIDGQLTEPCWSNKSAWLGSFRIGLSPVLAKHRREAWAAYDDKNLYIAVKLQREPEKALRAHTHEPDNAHIWKDDEVEVFVDAYGTGTDYYQLILNSEGFLFDAHHRWRTVPDPGGVGPLDTKQVRDTDLTWSSGLKRKISIQQDHWIIEMALPFKSVGLDSAPAGHRVRFNVTSADWETGEYTSLNRVSSWHDPLQFGGLALGQPRMEVSSLQLDNVGRGKNQLTLRIRETGVGVTALAGSGKDTGYRSELRLTTDKETKKFLTSFMVEKKKEFTSVSIPFIVNATSGTWNISLNILNQQNKSVYAVQRQGELPEALVMNISSKATFNDRPAVKVSAKLGISKLSLVDVKLQAAFLDTDNRVVKRQNLGTPTAAAFEALMPVKRIPPGRYQLRLTATRNNKVLATATDNILVSRSPFYSHHFGPLIWW